MNQTTHPFRDIFYYQSKVLFKCGKISQIFIYGGVHDWSIQSRREFFVLLFLAISILRQLEKKFQLSTIFYMISIQLSACVMQENPSPAVKKKKQNYSQIVSKLSV